MSLLAIWLIGKCSEPDLQEPIAWIQSHTACKCFDSPYEACDSKRNLKNGSFPEAIVLLQSRPGEFSANQVEKLHALEPLAGLIAITGPWCEGEQRSGRPIPGIVRIPWRSWRERLPYELGLWGSATPVPRTFTDTDRFDQLNRRASRNAGPPGQIAVCTANQSTYGYLADMIRQLGSESLSYQSTDSPIPEAVLFDGWAQVDAVSAQLSSNGSQSTQRRILLLDFPRPEDLAQAREAGIDAVLGRPLLAADLNMALAGSGAA